VVPLIYMLIGLTGVVYAISGFIWLFQNEDQLQKGSWDASGLLEIVVALFSGGAIYYSSLELIEHKTKQWYRHQWESLMRKGD